MNTSHPAVSEITALDAGALSMAIHRKQLSCREVMLAYLARIADENPRYNTISNLQDEELLMRQADERDEQLARGESMGWMHGMPQAIKDLSNTADIPTTFGSPLMLNYVPRNDGLMAQRMKAAGCIVLGKTNTPEFGLGSHTFNEAFGITRNAYDFSRSAGGSSGGAAASLARRMLPVADGSDFMGSLRNPAGWNNVFGMRPSQGRVPMWPIQDAWLNQLVTEGPMGRTVSDVARLLSVQAGFDQRAPLSIADGACFTGALDGLDCTKVRVGWLGDLSGYLAVEPGILAICGHGLTRLERLGCSVEPILLGTSPEEIWQAWLIWRHALIAALVGPFLANPKNRALIKPEALWEHEMGRGLTADELLRASVRRMAFYQHLLTLFEKHDFLALPVAQVWPFDAGQRWPRHINDVPMDTYHRWMEVAIYATFAGLPCISVPVGFDARGLPMGMQLIGKPRGDLEVLRLAHAYEQTATDVLRRKPPDID